LNGDIFKVKRKLKIIIPIAIVLIIAIIIVIVVFGGNTDTTTRVGTEPLMPQNLQNYISVSGTIESANSEQIYSKLQLPVDALNVSVGDVVKKGDVLATLDSDDIRENITKMEEQIAQTDTNSINQITDAEKNYNNALKDYNDGVNSQVLSAKRQLDNAETALDRTKTAYEDALELQSMDKSTQLQTVNRSVDSAQLNYDNMLRKWNSADTDALKALKDNMDDAKEIYDAAIGRTDGAEKEMAEAQKAYEDALNAYNEKSSPIAKFQPGESISDYFAALNQAKANLDAVAVKYDTEEAYDNYTAAKLAYDNAKKDLEDALKNAETSLENAKTQLQSVTDGTDDGITSATNALSDAELNYSNALRDYNLTIENVERNLSDLKTAAERARINAGFTSSQEISLQNLKDQLDDATLTSPIDGVVTYVNASEGDTPEGIMFTVEDIADLKMTVLVSEYDIASISLGMNCEIAPNSDPDTVYSGTITEIAPTTQKSALGVDAVTASFEFEVAVTSKETKLDIGMTAQVKLIYEEVDDVLSVSSDLVQTDQGGKYVFKAVEGTLGTYTAKKVYVTTGMETDFYISVTPVTAGELSEGDLIITDTGRVRDGETITLRQTAAMGAGGDFVAGMADGMYDQVGAVLGLGTPGNRPDSPPAGGGVDVQVVQVG
jgi:multidrug efflux pump subunit AcrA (membrane-fusion protein)